MNRVGPQIYTMCENIMFSFRRKQRKLADKEAVVIDRYVSMIRNVNGDFPFFFVKFWIDK